MVVVVKAADSEAANVAAAVEARLTVAVAATLDLSEVVAETAAEEEVVAMAALGAVGETVDSEAGVDKGLRWPFVVPLQAVQESICESLGSSITLFAKTDEHQFRHQTRRPGSSYHSCRRCTGQADCWQDD